jgi:hypothetical protein
VTEPVVSLRISANERGTAPERFAAIILETQRHPERWDVTVDGEAEVDLVFSVAKSEIHIRADVPGMPAHAQTAILPDKVLGVELKTPADFVGSLQGHLSEQRRNSPYPLRIAVLGSMGDVLRALPEVKANGWQNPHERAQAEAQIRRDISSLRASGVEVDFGMSYHDYLHVRYGDWTREKITSEVLAANVSQILHDARAILLSDTSLRMPKCESWQEYCLRGLPGIGPEKAKALIDADILPVLEAGVITNGRATPDDRLKWTYEQLLDVPGIGKKTAAKIMEAMK